jgi:beta-galactosidase
MNLGICYYPEHWDESRWETDAKLYRDAGLTIVRMAEFAWAQLEPRPGEFDFGWLDRALDIFAQHDFKLVLGTPTAAPPAWLARAHPDTLPVDEQNRKRNFGGRRHYCPNSAVYRQYTERIVRAMAEHYGSHPRVIGWQIDNEFGGGGTGRCYCENCVAAFQSWLQKKYQTLDALNDAWGNVFWSQRYEDWSHIGAPILVAGSKPNPSHLLDYYRFSSDSIRDYQQRQIAALQPLVSPAQFITHNFMGLFSDLEHYSVAAPLTFVTWDSYPTGQTDRWRAMTTDADPAAYAPDTGNPLLTNMAHDFTRGLKHGAPFWIMEQQAGYINWGEYNPAPRPGILHLWLWQNFAAGADTTVIFRDRAVDLAQEQYHSGLLHHDGSLAQGYLDLMSFKAQRAFMETLKDTRVQNDVALLVAFDDVWAIQIQPHHKDFSYWNHLFTYYAALQRAGVPCDLVSRDADLSRYKLVIAPTLHLADNALAARLQNYVEGGGTLVLGVRSGFKTMTNRVTLEPLPGALRALVGARVTSWQSLAPNGSHPVAFMWRGWQTVAATRWLETLEPDTAGVIAQYTGAHLDGKAAMTAHQVGAGRVFYVGWMPEHTQADALVAMFLPEAQVQSIGMLPPGVLAGRRVRDDETFLFLMNFTDAEKRGWVNGAGWRDAMTRGAVENEISIPPRSTRILNGKQKTGD